MGSYLNKTTRQAVTVMHQLLILTSVNNEDLLFNQQLSLIPITDIVVFGLVVNYRYWNRISLVTTNNYDYGHCTLYPSICRRNLPISRKHMFISPNPCLHQLFPSDSLVVCSQHFCLSVRSARYL